mmetsp:Transcript_16496/g.25487  ORF Transcript_16496/g.25487 Transcript_16496/m.25487 type:complete len:119 (-) Transcript_16496:10-366(-)
MVTLNLKALIDRDPVAYLEGAFSETITLHRLELLGSMLRACEDNGDVARLTYNLLKPLLKNAQLKERACNSKLMIHMGIRHSVSFECEEAYYFLEELVRGESRFKDTDMARLRPSSLK